MNVLNAPAVEVIPAWLYFVGPMVTLMMGGLATTVVSHYRKVQSGKLVPEATVVRMQTQYDTQITAMRTSFDTQLAAVRATFETQLTSKQRDADDWRGAYHLGAESWKMSEDRMDEVLEHQRLIYQIVRNFPPAEGPHDVP